MGMKRLVDAVRAKQNPTVAGLDPRLDYLPEFLKEKAYAEFGKTLEGAAAAVLEYNKALIDAMYDIVPAIKPQAAYYELYGWAGVKTLAETIAYARDKDMYVITDGKRNDIGTTMEAYAAAHLGLVDVDGEQYAPFDGDALTVNGYLGADGIKPLLSICKERDRGIFVLCKTSNPSSGELQDRLLDGEALYARMGDLCEAWGADTIDESGYSAVGAVVGATYPAQLAELRARLPHTYFLVPGYGAQGGGAADVAPAFDKDGMGAIVNSSRGILCAWKKEGCDPADFAGAARREAIRMKADLTSVW
ncbi:MAG: orotidine-5'-phosphate decarboxylase [Clostridia bacterium]|nr:orotidine-5'-phosphate decarboxylase [Clostridia bacterium]